MCTNSVVPDEVLVLHQSRHAGVIITLLLLLLLLLLFSRNKRGRLKYLRALSVDPKHTETHPAF
jgi:hypothetical protein